MSGGGVCAALRRYTHWFEQTALSLTRVCLTPTVWLLLPASCRVVKCVWEGAQLLYHCIRAVFAKGKHTNNNN